MATYNGHKNYNYWNVSLWIDNDEGLYNLARRCVRSRYCKTKDDAAASILEQLNDAGITHTPDGVKYNKSNICAALTGL